MQNQDIAKGADKNQNPSFESFRENEVFKPIYEEMKDRATTADKSVLRRYPDGRLDFEGLTSQIISIIVDLDYNKPITPFEAALVTTVLPGKFRLIEPKQAEIYTKLSPSEKAKLASMVEAGLKEVLNWNAGSGGSAIPGMHSTRR